MELLVQNENKQDENAAERPEKSVVRVTPRSSQNSECRSIDGVCLKFHSLKSARYRL